MKKPRTKEYICKGDPKDSDSSLHVYDGNGNRISRTYGANPKDPRSYVMVFYANQQLVSCTYGDDRKQRDKPKRKDYRQPWQMERQR